MSKYGFRDIVKRQVFMAIAAQISQLGTCDRKHVGAVIVRDGRCISWGFNGAPPGAPHCSENAHGHAYSVTGLTPAEVIGLGERIQEDGCRNATHAEANALAFAAREGISTDKSELYVTVSPCSVCARLTIAAGIHRVYYLEEYRDRSGIDVLHRSGVECNPL